MDLKKALLTLSLGLALCKDNQSLSHCVNSTSYKESLKDLLPASMAAVRDSL